MARWIEDLEAHPIVKASWQRRVDELFGYGTSSYPQAWEWVDGDRRWYLWAANTDRQVTIHWNASDPAIPYGEARPDVDFTYFRLTVEETRALAREYGLPIADWLVAALSACADDITPSSPVGQAEDFATFRALRAGFGGQQQ